VRVLATLAQLTIAALATLAPPAALHAAIQDHAYVAFDLSPDGKSIAFSAADADLYTLDLESFAVTQLTHTRELEFAPSYSPDGQRIVYGWTPDPAPDAGSASHIAVLDVASGKTTQLTDTRTASDVFPVFSHDGKTVAFARAYRHRPYSMGGMVWDDWDLCMINADGTDLRRLTTKRLRQIARLQFTPDDQAILYAITPGSGDLVRTTYIHDLQPDATFKLLLGGELLPERCAAWAGDPTLSPDGRTLAVISDRPDQSSEDTKYEYDVVVIDQSSGNPRRLHVTTRTEYNIQPSFTPDGKHIYYLAGNNRDFVGTIYSLCRVEIVTEQVTEIADSGLFSHPQTWRKQP
jgi:Tol biopolymer transport system component